MLGDGDLDNTVYRKKRWQLIAGGPLNARLFHGSETFTSDNIRVTLSCSDQDSVIDPSGAA